MTPPDPAAAGAGEVGRRTAMQRREAVLAAAVVEFASHGLHGASTDAIASAAGISQPYVFRLFGSKKALFIAVMDRCFDHVLAAFRDAAAAHPERPFEAMGAAYRALLADRDELLVQMQGYAACADGEIREVARSQWERLVAFLEGVPGGNAQRVDGFLARGMFLNVMAAVDMPALSAQRPWARRLLEKG